VPNPANPQCFNRYSYCLNNPLKYIDPSGYDTIIQPYTYKDQEGYILYDTDSGAIAFASDTGTMSQYLANYYKYTGESSVNVEIRDVPGDTSAIESAILSGIQAGIERSPGKTEPSLTIKIQSGGGLESIERYIWGRPDIGTFERPPYQWILTEYSNSSGVHFIINPSGMPVSVPPPEGMVIYWQRVHGSLLVAGGSAIIVLDVLGVIASGYISLLTPTPYSVAYNGLGIIFTGLEVGWNVNMPDLPIIPYP
jgi:hypothetical protein